MRFEPMALDNELVENTDASVLVDTVHPGAPLVISFGFVAWDKRPAFDFYGRLKKLEVTSGKPINRILVRDCQNSWYHREIPGLGRHVDEVAESLTGMIQAIAPSRVIMIGQSMGGYAAIMFGALLQVDAILSFGPLSFLCPKQALTYHDRRWLSVMMALEQNPPPVRYLDLPALCKAKGEKPELQIFFGTKPDANAPESVNLDVLHALRYEPLKHCHLHPYAESGHAVVKYLIDTGQMNGLLGKYIMGLEQPLNPVDTPLPPEWVAWLKENLALGLPTEQLLDVLKQHGFSEYQGRVALYACGRMGNL